MRHLCSPAIRACSVFLLLTSTPLGAALQDATPDEISIYESLLDSYRAGNHVIALEEAEQFNRARLSMIAARARREWEEAVLRLERQPAGASAVERDQLSSRRNALRRAIQSAAAFHLDLAMRAPTSVDMSLQFEPAARAMLLLEQRFGASTRPYGRTWYLATVYLFQGRGMFIEAETQATAALERFADDAEIRLAAGTVAELFASPLVVLLPARAVGANLQEAASERMRRAMLGRAIEHFEAVERLSATPADAAEARIRRARCLVELGRASDGAALLAQVAETDLQGWEGYLVQLLLGGAYAKTGRASEAEGALHRAIARCPTCQSAYVALALLHDERGDRAEAAATADRGLSAVPSASADDPWRRYFLGVSHRLDDMMRALRQAVAA